MCPAIGLALAVAGCRVGGTGTDPFAEIPAEVEQGGGGHGGAADPDNVGLLDTGGTTEIGAGGATATGAGGQNAPGDGGGAFGGRVDGSAAGAGPVTSLDGGSGTGALPGACQPAQPPAICDPVRNLGCLVPFSQCDVDPTQAVAAGRCSFPFRSTPPPPDAGTACYVDPTTETCLPMSTCVKGTCRKLCYCDADCAGECCKEPAPGLSGAFRLCGSC